MSLRNQPYLPLYVQDFMTDEKLSECSAQATGVYIRLMCLMHKSEHYGKILLRQKDKQNSNTCLNFAVKLVKQMPYTIDVIHESLIELIDEGVIQIEGDFIIQKRMVKDESISRVRSEAGKKSAFVKKLVTTKTSTKLSTNSEIENENENDIISNSIIETENKISKIKEDEYINWESVKKSFLCNDGWKIKFMTAKNIDKQTLEEQMNLFITEIELRADYKELKELFNHFTNYYNKQIKDERNSKTSKPKFGDTIKEAGNRFGNIGNLTGKDIIGIGRKGK